MSWCLSLLCTQSAIEFLLFFLNQVSDLSSLEISEAGNFQQHALQGSYVVLKIHSNQTGWGKFAMSSYIIEHLK